MVEPESPKFVNIRELAESIERKLDTILVRLERIDTIVVRIQNSIESRRSPYQQGGLPDYDASR